MKNRNRIRFLLILILSFVLAVAIGNAQTPTSYFETTTFDFGSVRQGPVVTGTFAIKNPDQASLTLSIAGMSHPGMTVRLPPQLAPGATGKITINWDTRAIQGEAKGQVLIRLNNKQSVPLSLVGKVIPPIDILPYPAVFISAFRDEKPTRTVEIVSNEPTPIKILGISNDSPARFKASFKAVQEGRRYVLTIEKIPGGTSGRSQDLVKMVTDHPQFPVISVPVNLLVKDDVYFTPESVDFGEITIKGGQEQGFLLKKRQGSLKIVSATSDLPFLNITHKASEGGSIHEFTISLKTNTLKPGEISGTISVRTDDSQYPELKIPVEGFIRNP